MSFVTTRSARAWFEGELHTRARLATSAAGESIVRAERTGDPEAMARLLDAIVRDERVVAAAVCNARGVLAARTALLPAGNTLCSRAAGGAELPSSKVPGTTTKAVSSPTYISVVPVAADGVEQGHLIVLQELAPAREREALIRRGALIVLVMLALAFWVLTIVSARLTSIGWVRQLARALRGERMAGRGPGANSALLEGVRALAQRSSAAALEGDPDGRWTRERLRHVLAEHVGDAGVVVVANREPYIHEYRPDGSIEVQHPASGLVTALEPVIRTCSGTWIAHGSGSADRVTSDKDGRLRVPPGEESYLLSRVWMTDEEEQGYYYGFANEGLWPVCHLAYARPTFRTEDWAMYRRINQRFADAVVAEVSIDDPIVLVQDYHFALAPRMIREQLPEATIITFWHIPWPNSERFSICPWREEIIDGLLGSSIVGFHTPAHCNHFIDAADTFLESRIDRTTDAVVRSGVPTLVRPYPISVEWPLRKLEGVPSPEICRREVMQELELREDAILAVGVDRLDYTKGIEERFEAVERLLERNPSMRGRFSFVQLAAPSRTTIPRYRELRESVELSVQRINERFGDEQYRPIILLREHHEPERVFRFYRAADMCYVSSLHDGMNLVSKEFVAARSDEQGVLILSRFAGAAEELPEALIVNPYDLEEASEALERAAFMSSAEQADRMRQLRAVVAQNNVYRWAGRMLFDAAQLRQRARRNVTLDEHHTPGGVARA
ncbi:MAG: trehalose-6-phosphate synthase [Gemmatimonadaceae bacterium]